MIKIDEPANNDNLFRKRTHIPPPDTLAFILRHNLLKVNPNPSFFATSHNDKLKKSVILKGIP